MLYETEDIVCPILNERGNYHFENLCEDCDVKELARMSLGDVEGRREQSRITLNEFDAYRWVWALFSPSGSNPHWKNQPYVLDPDVRRIARKLCRAKGLLVPAALN